MAIVTINIHLQEKGKVFSILLILEANLFKVDSQNMDEQTGGKWLIQGSKHNMDNPSQNLKYPCRISYLGM